MTMRSSISAAKIIGPCHEAEDTVVFEFRFNSNDPTFTGHFPGRPLLPGAFQIEMARISAEWTLNCPLLVREVTRAKFRRPLLPEEVVRLELKWAEADGIIQARSSLSVGGQPVSEASLQLWRSA